MGWIARKRKRSQRFYAIPDRDEGVSFSEKVAMGIMVFVGYRRKRGALDGVSWV